MNTYQEIVNSVQANILVPVTQLEEKNTLREKLDRELEEFFAKGGKPKVLAMGETEYRDGKIPTRNVTKKTNEKYIGPILETPTEVILSRNKDIRGDKPKLENKIKKQMLLDIKRKRVAEQKDVLDGFYEKANRTDIYKLAAVFDFNAKQLRDLLSNKALSDDDLKKLKDALVNFEFHVVVKKLSLKVGRKSKSKSPRIFTKEEKARKEIIRLARKTAIQNGEPSFLGECKTHGSTTYVFGANNHSKCAICKKEWAKRHHSEKVQTQEMKIEHERKLYNRNMMMEAAKNGEKRFTGNCLKHGSVEFILFDNPRIKTNKKLLPYCLRCTQCHKELSIDLRKKKKALRDAGKIGVVE